VFQAIMLVLIWLVIGTMTVGVGLIVFPIVYWFLVIRGADARADKARQKLQSTLMKDEKVLSTAIQNRIAALLVRRELVAITNSRIITIDRSWLGGFTMRDYQWKDLRDAKLEENIFPNLFGSNLKFNVGTNSVEMHINNIPSNVASEIYSQAQSEEQAWEEKRRVRALEESRAASGGVTIHSGSPSATGGGNVATSMLDELAKAKALFDGGAISDVEFQEIKAKVLARA
jgi:preprotein translocase subunit YajC